MSQNNRRTRFRLAFGYGGLFLLAAAFAGFLWSISLGPPKRAEGWVGIVTASTIPLLAVAWLGRRYSIWRLLAFSTAWLLFCTAAMMLYDKNSQYFSPCVPFGPMWHSFPHNDSLSWAEVFSFQVATGVVLLTTGLWRKHKEMAPPATLLIFAQIIAYLAFGSSAYLGVFNLSKTAETVFLDRSGFDHDFIETYLENKSKKDWDVSLTFHLARSFNPEFFTVFWRQNFDGHAQITTARALYNTDRDNFLVEFRDRKIETNQGTQILAELEKIGVLEVHQSTLGGFGLDGSTWLFEGHWGQDEIDLNAWSPTYNPSYTTADQAEAKEKIYLAGRLLLEQSGFAVCERELF